MSLCDGPFFFFSKVEPKVEHGDVGTRTLSTIGGIGNGRQFFRWKQTWAGQCGGAFGQRCRDVERAGMLHEPQVVVREETHDAKITEMGNYYNACNYPVHFRQTTMSKCCGTWFVLMHAA